MSMLKDAGIWVYKKVRGPVRGALTATGIIELTALGVAKGALIGGLLKGLVGIICGGVLGFVIACGVGIYLKNKMDKIDAAIAAEDQEFEMQILEEEKNNLDNEISLRAKLKALREQWAGEIKDGLRHGFSYKVTKLINKITRTFETKIKQLEIKIGGQPSPALLGTLQQRNAEETVIPISSNDPVVLRTAPNTPRQEQPAPIVAPAQDSSSIASTAFTVTKIFASVGTILTVAYYVANVGALVCAPIPYVGIPLGYVLGALGGVVLGTVFVSVFGESISKLKEMTESKKYQQDPEWKAELITFKKEISNTQKTLLELKQTLTTQGDIIREGMGQPLSPQDHHNKSANSSHHYTSLGDRNGSDETLPLLANTSISKSTQQNQRDLEIGQSDSTENKSPKGIWGWSLHYLNRFAHFIVLTVGGTAAVTTIATCTFYGALMGFKIGLPIPYIGPIGVCVIGGIVGFTIGLIGAYLGVTSCVSVVKELTDNDQKSCVNDELFNIIDELDKTHDQLISLEKELDDQLTLLDSHVTPQNTPRDSTNTAKEDLARIDINDATSSKSALAETTSPALLIIASATPFKKIYDGAKSRTKSAWQTTKSLFWKCVCGVGGLALIGLCAYQGVTLGLALGTVIPGPGNIIGAVTGGLIGAVCGLILVHSAAQGIKKIDRFINGDNVADTVAIVNEKITENKRIMENINEKQKKLDEEAFSAAFDVKNKNAWENRDPKEEAAKRKRESERNPPLERTLGRGTSGHHSANPTSVSRMERIDYSNPHSPPPVPAATDLQSAQQAQSTYNGARKTSQSASSLLAPTSAFYQPADSAGSASAVPTATATAPPSKPPPPKPSAETAAVKLPVPPHATEENLAPTSAHLPAGAAVPPAGAAPGKLPALKGAAGKIPALKGAAGKLPPQLLAAIATKGKLPPPSDPLPQPPPPQPNDTSSQRGVNP